MHYVIFSANHLPNIGGIERFTDGLSRALAKMDHQVTVVTNNTFGLDESETLCKGVDIIRLPCFPLIGGRMPLPKYNRAFGALWQRLLDARCDGVLINARFYAHTLLGMQFAKTQGLVPVVLDHGSAYLTFGNPVLDVFERAYERGITALVKLGNPAFYGISQKSVEWLKSFGIQAKGIINNSIDAAVYRDQASDRSFRRELGIHDDDLLLAFTGRFIPEKGIGVLLEMMKSLDGRPVHLVMAGDGPLCEDIHKEGIRNIHVVGRLDPPDIAALLFEADLFCFPSRSEGFSTSLLEAAACGTPALTTDVGGARELMPNSSYGFICSAADSMQFFQTVMRIITERVDLKVMGLRCRRLVETDYSWESVARRAINAMKDSGFRS